MIKRWTRLVQGLRIRQRLQEQYGNAPAPGAEAEAPVATTSNQGGAFVVNADDVVQAYHLPRYIHDAPSDAAGSDDQHSVGPSRDPPRSSSPADATANPPDSDEDMEELVIPNGTTTDPQAVPPSNNPLEKIDIPQSTNERKSSRVSKKRNRQGESPNHSLHTPKRSSRKSAASIAQEPTPSRTLRPRRSKTAAQLQEEREAELAIRRAMES